ncbi:MAG: ATP-binding protein [Gemmatales bacterium]|nr:ATP-binding protein [Gemmatales bacterium]MDW8387288.1 ATP-binding protein [Gemmatales bacterium]
MPATLGRRCHFQVWVVGFFMPTLFVIRGPDEGKRFEVAAPIISIGREASNTVRLHDTEVSRRHAEIVQTRDGYLLVDLKSSNGTYLNSVSIKESLIRSGDHIQLGQTVLVFTAAAGDGVSASDLAERINMISRAELEIPSAIVKAIREEEGSRLLAQPEQAAGPWLKNALANLSVMYQATQAVSHILDTDQLLEKIMDLIFQSIQADRGCIMLRNRDTGSFEPKAIRIRSGVDPEAKITISRTIMDYVLREGKGVLVSDASHDERFAPAQSIVRFGINEALCVPMKGRHETLGVIYLDTRVAPRDLKAEDAPTCKLTEDHLLLAIAIGHQAALALEETRYYQAMVQAERLAAIGQTIAAISHHVKNILQGLRTGSDLIRLGIQEDKRDMIEQGWKVVEKNQARIYDLVMDMLSYSKEREPALEPVDVNQLVRDVLELVDGVLKEKGIQLHLRLAENLPQIQADPEGIHRALLNLVQNAIDALEGRDKPALGLATSLDAEKQWLRIVVTDNGCGIATNKLEEIFKPFVSTKGSKGTGLGLAVSRKILREHGGDITAESILNKGSRFTIRLPVQLAASEGQASLQRTMVPDEASAPRK